MRIAIGLALLATLAIGVVAAAMRWRGSDNGRRLYL